MINEKKILQKLSLVFLNCQKRDFSLKREKWILLSDLHKGCGDGADDFKKCKSAYHAALGYYYAAGYTLALLGDVEELWENRISPVLKEYKDTLLLEQRFANANRLVRLAGNHDDKWDSLRIVNKYIRIYLNSCQILDGLVLNITDSNKDKPKPIFLVHGHQGTFESDQIGWLSRFVVRNVWRPIQRILHWRSTTPVNDFEIAKKHEEIMYKWANENNVILIAGHTHKPVFKSIIFADKIEAEIESLQCKLTEETNAQQKDRIQEQLNESCAQLEWERAKSKGIESGIQKCPNPIVFNTGCCSYSDGDITGIEIENGVIRLVRWPDDNGDPKKKILEQANLLQII
jgi:UDP-2,3-diacylglucosamine pyrophosphatase LpxH